MISKSKFKIDISMIEKLFVKAGIGNVTNIKPLGAGEYNSVYSADNAIDCKNCECESGQKCINCDNQFVIKIAPFGTQAMLTYEADMMAQEIYYYKLMSLANIKVPNIYYYDNTLTEIPVPYFIMEKVSGVQLDKAKLSKTDNDIVTEKLLEMVAKMHTVKGEKFGYIQNCQYDNWFDALVNMTNNLLNDAKVRNKKSKRGEKLLTYINYYENILRSVSCTLINFDIWYPNIFVDKICGEITLTWIDPERCFWGDKIADFVCLDFMNITLESKSKLIKIYNKVTDERIEINNDSSVRLAIMTGYLALIVQVEKYARYTKFNFGWWRNVISSKIFYSKAFKILEKFKNK